MIDVSEITIGDICMIPGEPMHRKAELTLTDYDCPNNPVFVGYDGSYEVWSVEIVPADGVTFDQHMALEDPNAPSNVMVGIIFIVMLQAAEVKRKRRAYMAAQPCG